MTLHPLRLPPGVDLRTELEALVRAGTLAPGFVVSGIGSLQDPSLRYAGEASACVLPGPHEVVALAGSLTPDGAHLHMVVADRLGRTFGGHVAGGNRVRTTMEILLACPAGWRLARALDAATGDRELLAVPRDAARIDHAGTVSTGRAAPETKEQPMAGVFEIKGNDKGEYSFVLKAANGEVVLRSQQYAAKSGAQAGVASVQANCAQADRYEKLVAGDGRHYFNLKAANQQVIGTSQMYTTTSARDAGIASVMAHAPAAAVGDAA